MTLFTNYLFNFSSIVIVWIISKQYRCTLFTNYLFNLPKNIEICSDSLQNRLSINIFSFLTAFLVKKKIRIPFFNTTKIKILPFLNLFSFFCFPSLKLAFVRKEHLLKLIPTCRLRRVTLGLIIV